MRRNDSPVSEISTKSQQSSLFNNDNSVGGGGGAYGGRGPLCSGHASSSNEGYAASRHQRPKQIVVTTGNWNKIILVRNVSDPDCIFIGNGHHHFHQHTHHSHHQQQQQQQPQILQIDPRSHQSQLVHHHVIPAVASTSGSGSRISPNPSHPSPINHRQSSSRQQQYSYRESGKPEVVVCLHFEMFVYISEHSGSLSSEPIEHPLQKLEHSGAASSSSTVTSCHTTEGN